MIRKPSTGLQVRLPADVSMTRQIRTVEMCITGMYGMETSRSRITGITTSAMQVNLDSSPSRLLRQSKLLPMIRQTGTFSLMLWKNIREMQAQTERS